MKRMVCLIVAGSLLIAACDRGKEDNKGGATAEPEPEGKIMVEKHCGTCHMVPEPADLDRKTWKDHILVRMAAYMGIYNDNERYYDSVPAKWVEPGIGGERIRSAGVYPDKPMLSREDWEKLRDYILAQAPSSTQGPPGIQPVTMDLSLFRPRIVRPDTNLQPFVTALGIDAANRRLYASFFQQPLLSLDPAGKITDMAEGYYGPVFLQQDMNGLTLADIGSMKGSDHPRGSVITAPNFAALRKNKPSFRLDSLMRPVMARWADLDADGDQDVVIAEFGYHLGELAWHENVGKGRFVRHTLFPDDGTVSIAVADFTGDGRPDILSLQANADERIDLYVNEGNGRFRPSMLFRFNPTYGFAAMQIVDWNGDGKMDFIVANGDNGDYPPTLKPNHGLRLYLNEGEGKFSLAHYFPMNGAYGLRVRDFDMDGDLDVAAVAFYPDYLSRPDHAFVYFENQGGMKFQARSLPEVGLSRWMVMEAGDLDGDGDEDIVLGAFNVKSGDASDATYEQWMKNNVPILILENTLRNP